MQCPRGAGLGRLRPKPWSWASRRGVAPFKPSMTEEDVAEEEVEAHLVVVEEAVDVVVVVIKRMPLAINFCKKFHRPFNLKVYESVYDTYIYFNLRRISYIILFKNF